MVEHTIVQYCITRASRSFEPARSVAPLNMTLVIGPSFLDDGEICLIDLIGSSDRDDILKCGKDMVRMVRIDSHHLDGCLSRPQSQSY